MTVYNCRKQFFLTALISSAFATTLAAQIPNRIVDQHYIEVTGTSETEVTPDEIIIDLTLAEGKDKMPIDQQETELKKQLKEIGIDVSQLTLNKADADYRKVRVLKKDVMIRREYLLKVNSAAQVATVYEKLDKLNAEDAYITRFSSSHIVEIQKENRIKAVKAAKEKADYLLAALGQHTGAPITIIESVNYAEDRPQPRFDRMVANSVSFEDQGQGDSISFRKIKVRSSFLVRYEISAN